jgi:hypothetical protein
VLCQVIYALSYGYGRIHVKANAVHVGEPATAELVNVDGVKRGVVNVLGDAAKQEEISPVHDGRRDGLINCSKGRRPSVAPHLARRMGGRGEGGGTREHASGIKNSNRFPFFS